MLGPLVSRLQKGAELAARSEQRDEEIELTLVREGGKRAAGTANDDQVARRAIDGDILGGVGAGRVEGRLPECRSVWTDLEDDRPRVAIGFDVGDADDPLLSTRSR